MSTLEKVANEKLSLDSTPGGGKWRETLEKMLNSPPLKNVSERVRSRFFKPPRVVAHCLVVDTGNSTLVALGTQIPGMIFLKDSLMDTVAYVGVTNQEVLEIKTLDPRTYPEWSWDFRSRQFSKTNPAIITEQMRDRAALAAKKGDIITRAIYLINRARDKVNTGLFFQETIYAAKLKQAQMLKDAGFDEGLALSAPYVVQHAEEAGMPLESAAEDILFQAQLFQEHLEKTERVRLVLFRKLKLARTVKELDEIMERFQREGVA